MGTWRGWLTPAWSVALALLLLGPALGPGYLLTYDMVWVPDLALRPDFLGLGTGLPRAVPSDAVVAVLDEVVPGWLLQKAVLLGSLVAGGIGAARWVGADAQAGRLVAVAVYQWNPWVVERLAIGHWPVLVGYAVLPWLGLAARRWRRGEGAAGLLLVLVPLGSLSVSAGLASAVVALALGWCGRARRDLVLVALLAAGNAPWLVSGALHAREATTDPAGAGVFALDGVGALPAPLTALGLGGTWNTEVVLPSREGALAWVALALLVVGAAAGWRRWRAETAPRDAAALVGCWAVGLVAALATWGVPDLVSWAGESLPGAGVLRDGARALALCALLPAVLCGHAAASAWLRAGPGAARIVLTGVLAVLPVTVLPDAAGGLDGRLRPVSFPGDFAAARESVDDAVADGQEGDVLLLPLSSYRQPEWNHDRKVLDPWGRYLAPDYVASDELVVSGVHVAGEDPRARRVAEALQLPEPGDRAAALAEEGIGLVVVDRSAPGEAAPPAGTVLLDRGSVRVLALADVTARDTPAGWLLAAGLAWTAYAASLGAGALLLGRSRWRRRSAPTA